MDYDEALSRYLETYEADEIFNIFAAAIRMAFRAGFKAAGGELPSEQPVLRVLAEADAFRKSST